MEHKSAKEVSEKLGISERCIQMVYEENRIVGVICFSHARAISKDAEKTVDAPYKNTG